MDWSEKRELESASSSIYFSSMYICYTYIYDLILNAWKCYMFLVSLKLMAPRRLFKQVSFFLFCMLTWLWMFWNVTSNVYSNVKMLSNPVLLHLLVSSHFTLLIWDLYFSVWYSNFTDLSLYLTDLTLYLTDLTLYLTDFDSF